MDLILPSFCIIKCLHELSITCPFAHTKIMLLNNFKPNEYVFKFLMTVKKSIKLKAMHEVMCMAFFLPLG